MKLGKILNEGFVGYVNVQKNSASTLSRKCNGVFRVTVGLSVLFLGM